MPFIWIFSFSTGLVPNRYDYMRFLVCLWLTNGSPNGSFKWTGAVWWSKPVHLSEFVRTHIIQIFIYTAVYTTKNTVILPNFVVWKFCGKAQFPHSFGRIVRNYAETVPFQKKFPHHEIWQNYKIFQCYLQHISVHNSLSFTTENKRGNCIGSTMVINYSLSNRFFCNSLSIH